MNTEAHMSIEDLRALVVGDPVYHTATHEKFIVVEGVTQKAYLRRRGLKIFIERIYQVRVNRTGDRLGTYLRITSHNYDHWALGYAGSRNYVG